MIKEMQITCFPGQHNKPDEIKKILSKKLNKKPEDITSVQVIKRSLDARGDKVKYNIKLNYSLDQDIPAARDVSFRPGNVTRAKEVLIVGMGPAGIFAALRLIEKGLKPVILERGKPVEERKHDIAALHRNQKVNPNSNYAFGEGGAGTYSDGKLYTRSKKRGDKEYVMHVLHQFGAPDDILVDARPHIGTDKLPGIIGNIRRAILDAGGEIHFNTLVTGFDIKNGIFAAANCADGQQYKASSLILASGHSAHDIYEWFDNNKLPLEAKSFAMGVRVEHPQELINKIRYGKAYKHPDLPAAEYNVAVQTKDRGVFSFCMCPGGSIVPASTEDNALVVNGMSNSRRNLPWANAGLVAGVTPDDVYKATGEKSALAGLQFQKETEAKAYLNGAEGLIAPAQRLGDFVRGNLSADLPKGSYSPGMVSSPVHFWMPEFLSQALRDGIKKINRPLKGFLTNDAVVVGLESRTSSPVRIPRDKDNLEYTACKGLYPAGEGAGYAGGIVSSAVDGLNAAEAVSRQQT
ncbi:MAG: NAD(P)/FAD-dependent oxidoreductase [Bacteroidales bacterium]